MIATTARRAQAVGLLVILLAIITVGTVNGQAPPPPNPFAIPLTVTRSDDGMSATARWTPNAGAEYQGFFVVAKLFATEPDTAGYGVKLDTFRYVDWPLTGNASSLTITGLEFNRGYFYGVISTSRDSSGNWVWSAWEIVQDVAPVVVPPATKTLPELAAKASPSVVRVFTDTGTGSGFIVDSAGLVITNHHVVSNDVGLKVRLSGETTAVGATLVGYDALADLALLRIDGTGIYPTLTLRDSDTVLNGESVFALGYPVGYTPGNPPTVTQGIISNRATTVHDVEEFITDAALNPGNSGGPLMDYQGRVVGVNVAVRPDADNVGYAITANELNSRLPSLKAGSNVLPPASQWNGYGDPGVVTYSGWKNWDDHTSKFRLYVPEAWTLGGDLENAYEIVYYSPDGTASALVYEFSLEDPSEDDLRAVAMNYVKLLKEDADVFGTPTIRSRQNEITGWTEYVIQWEKRPLFGDCEVSGTQFRELWVLGERGLSDEGRLLALELARCKSATTHQPTLDAIESRFQYWR